MLTRLFNPNYLIGCGGDINQSKSVPMMSLNVVGNINQSNSRGLCRSSWMVSAGLCGWWWGGLTNENLCQWCHWLWWGILTNQILEISMGGLWGSLWFVVGLINQSKSVPMMSLNVVGNINQSNSRGLHGWSLWVSTGGLHGRSLWVVSVGLHGRSLWMVSAGGLCGWSPQVVSTGGLCEWSPWVSVGGLHRFLMPMILLAVGCP